MRLMFLDKTKFKKFKSVTCELSAIVWTDLLLPFKSVQENKTSLINQFCLHSDTYILQGGMLAILIFLCDSHCL